MISRRAKEDDPIVYPDHYQGDLNKALRVLTQRLNAAGVFKIIKQRRFDASPSARKRAKFRRSEIRRKRIEAKRNGSK